MATDDWDDDLVREGEVAENLRNEGRRADNVQSGNTEEPAGQCKFVRCARLRDTHLFGSNTPCFLKTSATMGTVEFTGLEITRTNALGAVVAIPVARSRTIPALIYTYVSSTLLRQVRRMYLEKIISARSGISYRSQSMTGVIKVTNLVIYKGGRDEL